MCAKYVMVDFRVSTHVWHIELVVELFALIEQAIFVFLYVKVINKE